MKFANLISAEDLNERKARYYDQREDLVCELIEDINKALDNYAKCPYKEYAVAIVNRPIYTSVLEKMRDYLKLSDWEEIWVNINADANGNRPYTTFVLLTEDTKENWQNADMKAKNGFLLLYSK